MSGDVLIRPTHYRALLTDPQKLAYRIITAALLRRQYKIALASANVSGDDIPVVVRAVHYDHPEIFWVQFWHYHKTVTPLTGRCISVTFKALIDSDMITACQATLDSRISDVKRRLLYNATYWSIARYVASDIEYQDTEDALLCHTVQGPLLRHSAVCEGIAKLYLIYCQHLGLPCAAVAGTSRGIAHMWNAVATPNGARYVDITSQLAFVKHTGRCSPNFFKTADQLELLGYEWDRSATGL